MLSWAGGESGTTAARLRGLAWGAQQWCPALPAQRQSRQEVPNSQTQIPITVAIYAETASERAEEIISQAQSNNQREISVFGQSTPDGPWLFQQRLPPTTAGTPVAADVPPPLHRKVIASGEVESGAALPPSGDPASAVSSPSPVPRCACGVSKDDLTKSGYKRHPLSCSAMKQYRLATQAARKRAASASPAQPSPDINLAAETPGDNTQEPDVEMLPPSIVDCPPPPAAPPSSLAAPGANMVLAPPAPIAAPAAAAHEAAPSAPSVPASLCSFVGGK